MSMFQRYRSNTPGTLHAGLAWGSHVELLSPGAQQLSETQPAWDRDAPSSPTLCKPGAKAELPHQSLAFPSASPRLREKAPRKGQATSYAPQCCRRASISPRQMVGRGRARRRKEGNKFKTRIRIGKVPAQPSAPRDKNTRLAVTSSVEGPTTGAKADADDALLHVPP